MGKGKPSRALTQRDDDELVAHVRGGCADAFAVLHARYHSPVLAFVRRTLPRALAGDAEDVTQEVFLRAYRGLHATGNAIQLRPWLFRIAFNRCMDYRRRRSPTATDWQIDAAPAMAPGPHAQLERREELASMIADIGRLPDQQRAAVVLRELGGWTYQEIAHELAVTMAAVKSLLVRARDNLHGAATARNTTCRQIREEILERRRSGLRPTRRTRQHVLVCDSCSAFRTAIAVQRRARAGHVPQHA